MKLNEMLFTGGIAGVIGASITFAQIAASSTPALYTAAQAAHGATLYAAQCAVCHGAQLEGSTGPALSGATFSQTAAAQQMTVKSLFDKMATTMPTSAPGSLTPEEYEALMAFTLQKNGFPAGSKAFSKDSPGLDQIKLGASAPAEASNGSAPTGRLTSSGVFTEAQATHGKTLYFETCLQCHGSDLGGVEGAPPVAGSTFMAKWINQPVGALDSLIEKTMPPGNGGALGPQGDADVVAYILSKNSYPSGSTALPSSPRALAEIMIDQVPSVGK